MTLETGDADEPSEARLRYYLSGDMAQHFAIHKETGEVRVAARLDREARAAYRLRAHAQDRERADWECSSELLVTLDDVNDNAPRFSANTYSVTLPEDADLGTLVAKVPTIAHYYVTGNAWQAFIFKQSYAHLKGEYCA